MKVASSPVLGHGLDVVRVEETLSFPLRGTGVVNRCRGIERGLAVLALGVWGTCGALVGGRWGDGAFGSLAVAHEEMIIALERANASFEKDNLCVETVGRDRCPPINRRDTVRENKDVISLGIKDTSGVTGAICYLDEEIGGSVSPTYQWGNGYNKWGDDDNSGRQVCTRWRPHRKRPMFCRLYTHAKGEGWREGGKKMGKSGLDLGAGGR